MVTIGSLTHAYQLQEPSDNSPGPDDIQSSFARYKAAMHHFFSLLHNLDIDRKDIL